MLKKIGGNFRMLCEQALISAIFGGKVIIVFDDFFNKRKTIIFLIPSQLLKIWIKLESFPV